MEDRVWRTGYGYLTSAAGTADLSNAPEIIRATNHWLEQSMAEQDYFNKWTIAC